MKILNLKLEESGLLDSFKKTKKEYHLLSALLCAWFGLQWMFNGNDLQTGYIDHNIWLLIILGMITFLVVMALCWWLLERFWRVIGLPRLEFMVVHFKEMQIWQQLGFYLLSFALLLLTVVSCIAAIC